VSVLGLIGDLAFEYGFPPDKPVRRLLSLPFGATPSETSRLKIGECIKCQMMTVVVELAQTASRVFHALWLTIFFADSGWQVRSRLLHKPDIAIPE